MTPAERVDIAELIRCAANMREAANNLWWAHNPDRLHGEDDSKEPPTLEDAQEAHADAFRALQRAEWYAQRVLDRDARASASAGASNTPVPDQFLPFRVEEQTGAYPHQNEWEVWTAGDDDTAFQVAVCNSQLMAEAIAHYGRELLQRAHPRQESGHG